MRIEDAVRILVENKPTRKWINPDCDELAEAIETVAAHFTPAGTDWEGGGHCWCHVCEECHGVVSERDSYCRHCGQKL